MGPLGTHSLLEAIYTLEIFEHHFISKISTIPWHATTSSCSVASHLQAYRGYVSFARRPLILSLLSRNCTIKKLQTSLYFELWLLIDSFQNLNLIHLLISDELRLRGY